MTRRTRYGIRVPHSMVPCVEVTTGIDTAQSGPRGDWGQAVISSEVVKRVYGFTLAHAMARALTWTRKHGDPR